MDVGRQISEALGRLIDSTLDPAMLRAAENGVFPQKLWDSLAKLELDKALVSPVRGGHGLGWSEIASALRTIGAAALPAPIGEHMIAKALLDAAGAAAPEGLLTLPTRPNSAAEMNGDRVSGALRAIPWAGAADHLVAECTHADGGRLVALPMDSLSRTPIGSLSREPYETAHADRVAPSVAIPAKTGALLCMGALLRALQICGALNQVLDITVEYANVREQFGRPIGRFQAVQQLLAEMASEVAAANAVTEMAVRAMDRDAAFLPAAIAKARSSVAADRVASIAHEVHAAIGVTEELGLHHLTRRLWQWRDDFGGEQYWFEEIGRQTLDLGADSLWPTLIAASGGVDALTDPRHR